MDSSQEYRLTTDIKNFSKARVHKLDYHFWDGHSTNGWFPDLPVDTGGALTQAGELPQGVKWGISYGDGDDSTARKWVVAVDGPAGKVYAEAGPIGPVDWNVVKVKLDASGSKADYTDPIFGGRVVAEITDNSAIVKFYN